MNPHRSGMDYLLEIDEPKDENALLLTKALLALRMSSPKNGRAAEIRRVARAEIVRKLRRAA